jgi:hypothetical protein
MSLFDVLGRPRRLAQKFHGLKKIGSVVPSLQKDPQFAGEFVVLRLAGFLSQRL